MTDILTTFVHLSWQPCCLGPTRAGVQRDLLVRLHRVVSLEDLTRIYFGPLRIELPYLQLDNLDRPGKGCEDPGSYTFAPARPSTSLLANLQLVVKRLSV